MSPYAWGILVGAVAGIRSPIPYYSPPPILLVLSRQYGFFSYRENIMGDIYTYRNTYDRDDIPLYLTENQ